MPQFFDYLFIVFSLAWFVVFGYQCVKFGANIFLPLLFGGAMYATSTQNDIDAMILLADIRPGQKVVDLGAGDGRIIMALAKKGIEAHGYEINPALVFRARQAIKNAGLEQKAFMHQGNFWNQNLAGFDVIMVYGISFAMARLEQKLKKEANPGAKIISNYFSFKTWTPVRKSGRAILYEN